MQVETGEMSSDTELDRRIDLLKMGIGSEIAESEKTNLLSYFIKIDAYDQAIKNDKSLFIGRKGTGKSALFIKLQDELDQDEANYNIILKPD